jgi:hypothetical protein
VSYVCDAERTEEGKLWKKTFMRQTIINKIENKNNEKFMFMETVESRSTVKGGEGEGGTWKTYQVPPLYNKLFAYAKVFTFYLS